MATPTADVRTRSMRKSSEQGRKGVRGIKMGLDLVDVDMTLGLVELKGGASYRQVTDQRLISSGRGLVE